MSALPQRKVVRLGGKDYEVREPTFGDFADLQEAGLDFGKMSKDLKDGGTLTLKQIGTLLWVCCRKRTDHEKEAWRPAKEHFLHTMAMAEVHAAMPVVVELIAGPLVPSGTESTG